MKTLRMNLCVTAVATLLAATPCFAADSPWNGRWKINLDKSKVTGETFTFSMSGSMMHFTNGSTVSYDFACDGKDYPTIADRTVSCMKNDRNAFDSVSKLKGTELAKTHRELSADGKTLSVTTTGKSPDGSAFTDSNVYSRETPGTGLAGKWKNVKSTTSAPDVIDVKMAAPDSIHWDVPAYKESLDGKTDGKAIPMIGPTTPAGLTISFKKVSATKLTYEVKLKDKMMAEGDQTLAADGKTITDTSWVAGKPTEKEVNVYEKQ